MSKINKDILKGIWKQMWFAALLLYISYFFYRWIGVYMSKLLGQISDGLLYKEGNPFNSEIYWRLAVAFILTLFLMPAMDLITNIVIFRRGLRYEKFVTDAVFKKDYETLQALQAGEWIGRISGDSLQYRLMAVITPTRILADGTVLSMAAITLFKTDVFLALFLISGILLSLIIQYVYRKKNNRILEETRTYQDNKRLHQLEMVRMHSFWKMYGCNETLSYKMKENYKQFFEKTKRKALSHNAMMELLQMGIILALFVVTLFYGLKQVKNSQMTVGSFVMSYFMIMQIKNMAESILTNSQVLRGYSAQEKRIEKLIHGREEAGNCDIQEWNELYFEKVSYHYSDISEGMPERSFCIKYGEYAELDGRNGSGKTTLLKLLCGLFPSRNNQIKLDENCLADLNLATWRNRIGFIQQFPDVFPGTVRENVYIGNMYAGKEKVDAMLVKVGLAKLAEREIGGTKEELSGGEIKRIELARVLLRLEQCDLLMLDEPFENLDETGRKLVEEILDTHKAMIFVSHSKS